MRKQLSHIQRFSAPAPARCALAFAVLALGFAVCLPLTAVAQDAGDLKAIAESRQSQSIAEKIQNSTVTVRIRRNKPVAKPAAQPKVKASKKQSSKKQKSAKAASQAEPKSAATAAEITVCSGVIVGRKFVVTHDDIRESRTTQPDRYRITLPDGKQAKARLAVVDQYSQLHLLEVDQADLVSLPVAKHAPKVGARIMGGAAAGIDKAVISLGMIGAVDRSLPGVYLPPLVQCDIRTLETSTGSGIFNLTGQLVGIVTYTDPPERRNGWTYAVPASQVARLMKAHVQGELIVMGRRRPLVGMKLGVSKEPGVCVVEHVTKDGPADLAGIQPGDIVREASGRKIRSPYQAVRQVINRQPGDKLTMLIERNKNAQSIEITLGGGAASPVDGSSAQGMGLVQQNVHVKPMPEGGYEISGQDNGVRIVPGQRAPLHMSLDRVETLEKQLIQYREEITRLHKQIRHRDMAQAELQKLITQMFGELRAMKKSQDAEKAERSR
jgi:S1-C subfamily serine protease